MGPLQGFQDQAMHMPSTKWWVSPVCRCVSTGSAADPVSEAGKSGIGTFSVTRMFLSRQAAV
ncbi:MAG: hypothetical protein DI604_28245 [Delftia acidovorans]|nr:MAG: hypothetical protein DI604_28245 [Delftia acidovorans]